mmetsp:Transcript_34376/g.54990  ORF Transcript_34376/g.54990 Transcript_34376/m.54990 type:complete len:102 (+) Transcript_34376:10-315(+)
MPQVGGARGWAGRAKEGDTAVVLGGALYPLGRKPLRPGMAATDQSASFVLIVQQTTQVLPRQYQSKYQYTCIGSGKSCGIIRNEGVLSSCVLWNTIYSQGE